MRAKLISTILLFTACLLSTSAEGKPWEKLSPLSVPRHDLKLVEHEGAVYALTGADDYDVDMVERYDIGADKWEELAPIPQPRGWFACAVIEDEIYVAGGKRIRSEEEREESGDGSKFEYLDSLYIYSIDDDSWREGPPMSEPRAGLRGTSHDGKFYTFGGNRSSKVEVYDPEQGKWKELDPIPPGERMAPAVVEFEDKIYVIGGFDHDGGRMQNSLLVFDPVTGEWTENNPMPTARCDHVAVVAEGHIYSFGGRNDAEGISNSVEVYDPETDRWSVEIPMPAPAAWMGGCVYDGVIYLGGGARTPNDGYLWLDEFYAYHPDRAAKKQREDFENITRVIELRAGVRYVVPSDLEELKGRNRP